MTREKAYWLPDCAEYWFEKVGGSGQVEVFDYSARQEQEINRLADTLEQYMDLDKTFACLGH